VLGFEDLVFVVLYALAVFFVVGIFFFLKLEATNADFQYLCGMAAAQAALTLIPSKFELATKFQASLFESTMLPIMNTIVATVIVAVMIMLADVLFGQSARARACDRLNDAVERAGHAILEQWSPAGGDVQRCASAPALLEGISSRSSAVVRDAVVNFSLQLQRRIEGIENKSELELLNLDIGELNEVVPIAAVETPFGKPAFDAELYSGLLKHLTNVARFIEATYWARGHGQNDVSPVEFDAQLKAMLDELKLRTQFVTQSDSPKRRCFLEFWVPMERHEGNLGRLNTTFYEPDFLSRVGEGSQLVNLLGSCIIKEIHAMQEEFLVHVQTSVTPLEPSPEREEQGSDAMAHIHSV